MKTRFNIGKRCREFFSVSLFLFFVSNVFCSSLNGRIGGAEGDTLYPLSDPRNPNCPCHQYQQLAEKEYDSELKMNNEELKIESKDEGNHFVIASNSSLRAQRPVPHSSGSNLSVKTNTNHKVHKAFRRGHKENYLRAIDNWIYKKKTRWVYLTSNNKKRKTKLDKCFLW